MNDINNHKNIRFFDITKFIMWYHKMVFNIKYVIEFMISGWRYQIVDLWYNEVEN